LNPTSVFVGSSAEDDREADEAAGAGCTVGAEGKDRAWPVVPFEKEEAAASADLKARTSRAISRQVMNSV
jgi:hypothetical protein